MVEVEAGVGEQVMVGVREVAQGRTLAETLQIAQDVAGKLIESYREHGDPLAPELVL